MNTRVASVGGENRSATYSPCGLYRYELAVSFPGDLFAGGTCAFIGLNPSTATELQDDPTIRRIKGFVQAWGFTRLVMLNAYAFRSTDPRGLWSQQDPVGVANDATIARVAAEAGRICLAWGVHVQPGRRLELATLLAPHAEKLVCLGTNQDGSPKHPLYLASDTKAEPFSFKKDG
jgi:hypothetical protein